MKLALEVVSCARPEADGEELTVKRWIRLDDADEVVLGEGVRQLLKLLAGRDEDDDVRVDREARGQPGGEAGGVRDLRGGDAGPEIISDYDVLVRSVGGARRLTVNARRGA